MKRCTSKMTHTQHLEPFKSKVHSWTSPHHSLVPILKCTHSVVTHTLYLQKLNKYQINNCPSINLFASILLAMSSKMLMFAASGILSFGVVFSYSPFSLSAVIGGRRLLIDSFLLMWPAMTELLIFWGCLEPMNCIWWFKTICWMRIRQI